VTASILPAVTALFSDSLRETLVSLRRAIHQQPELSFRETGTADKLAAALHAVGVAEVTRVANTGVIARVHGRNRNAPVVAVRGDIDALPIQEATGLPYASTVPGVMHACGHDVHATWAVGAAALLAARPAEGDVLVVFQPAEETGKGRDWRSSRPGCSAVSRRFLAATSIVVSKSVKSWRMRVRFAASADMFEIELLGAGAHAARPHESRDPIVAAAAIISALQSIVSRRLKSGDTGSRNGRQHSRGVGVERHS
jgi:amidohydrolase